MAREIFSAPIAVVVVVAFQTEAVIETVSPISSFGLPMIDIAFLSCTLVQKYLHMSKDVNILKSILLTSVCLNEGHGKITEMAMLARIKKCKKTRSH